MIYYLILQNVTISTKKLIKAKVLVPKCRKSCQRDIKKGF